LLDFLEYRFAGYELGASGLNGLLSCKQKAGFAQGRLFRNRRMFQSLVAYAPTRARSRPQTGIGTALGS